MVERLSSFATQPIDAGTSFVWIVGDPIAQVKAPQVMNPHYLRAGDNLLVIPAPVPANDLARVFDAAQHIGNVRGWIVTVPHKVQLAAHIDELSLAARVAGAVNAVRFRDGRSHGDLFDGVGFAASLATRGFDVRAKAALVLGAGGVGSAISLALGQGGAQRVTIFDVDTARAQSLVRRLNEQAQVATRFECGSPGAAREADLIVNASPVGMAGDLRSPIDLALLTPRHTVAEVIMTPEVTPLLQAAMRIGCDIHPGKQVLEGQLDKLLDFFR